MLSSVILQLISLFNVSENFCYFVFNDVFNVYWLNWNRELWYFTGIDKFSFL